MGAPAAEVEEKVMEHEMTANDILHSVLVSRSASRCSSGKSSALGTPTTVLGIHSKNSYWTKPKNREHRIAMKYGSQQQVIPRKSKPMGRNKELAPNGIRKNTPILKQSA